MKNYLVCSICRRRSFLGRLIVLFIFIGIFIQVQYHLFNKKPLETNLQQETIEINLPVKGRQLACTGDPLKLWCKNVVDFCNSSLSIYQKLFIVTKSIVLQPKLAIGKRTGGENVQDVLNQAEEDEYFKYEKNFLQHSCQIPDLSKNVPVSQLSNIFTSMTTSNMSSSIEIINRTTIAVTRQDYVNIYHTITDLYTSYVLCRFIRKDPKSVQILFLDAHPKGNLDLLWSKMFHSFVRLGHLKNHSSIFYKELIWAQPQPTSELDLQQNHRESLSFFSDFREHIIQQFDLNPQLNLEINCQKLNILFLVRHNYVAHPRNPSGKISRQLENEQQILSELKTKFTQYPTINFTSNHFEEMSLQEQLNIVLNTDIFIGIHGAGLTHVVFQKSNRALIELVPSSAIGHHFELLSSINKVRYLRCAIENGSPQTTEKIFDCIQLKLQELCPNMNSMTISTNKTNT